MKPYKNRELLYQKVIVEGKSYQQTAKEIGCSYTAVRNWCMKFGFTKFVLRKPTTLVVGMKRSTTSTSRKNEARSGK